MVAVNSDKHLILIAGGLDCVVTFLTKLRRNLRTGFITGAGCFYQLLVEYYLNRLVRPWLITTLNHCKWCIECPHFRPIAIIKSYIVLY